MDRHLDTDLLIKSSHLVYFRLAFALVSLMFGLCIASVQKPDIEPVAFFQIAASVVVYSFVALLVLRRKMVHNNRALQFLNAGLLGLDIVALSSLVHHTRGAESDLYFLYLLPILLSSHTFGRKGIFVTACVSSAAYILTLLYGNMDFLPFHGPQEGLAGAYSQRLWVKLLTRGTILFSVAVIWAAFCEHMREVAQQGATRLRGQLDENYRLMDETRAQAAREQLINSISHAIRSTLDLNQILGTTVTQLSSALGSSRCAIITPGGNSDEPPAIWEAIHSGHQHSHETFFSPRFCEFLLETKSKYEESDNHSKDLKKTFVFEEPQSDVAFADIAEELKKLEFQSLIAQPIMYGSESKGVLLIAECERKRSWNPFEVELIKSVAGQVAIAIEHARLVDQLSRKNKDLLHKNLHLDAKNLELRTVQSQMIHQEKMASLGRMVAGIAHELNNPVNFVHGNLPYLREYFEDMKTVIEAVDQLPEQHRAHVEELKAKVKYDFLVTDLDHILADLAEGAERIRQIIRNLRSFSRLDEAELKEASIQEGVESTIKILSQFYGRDKIQAETKFQDIPPVVCYPGKLNQVWMNLLSNAAQAVADEKNPSVAVCTELDGDWVIVSIKDNGPGIKPVDQSKIFEPFYTTKPVGQGTGLGLSICHSIIERHGGSIWFETEAGKGTTFKVKIPLKAEPEKDELRSSELANRD